MNSKKLLLTVLLSAPLMGFAQSVLNADISYAAEASKGDVFKGVVIKAKNNLDLSQLTAPGKPFAEISALVDPLTRLQQDWEARAATLNNKMNTMFDDTDSEVGKAEKYIVDLAKDIAALDMNVIKTENAEKRFSDEELQEIGNIANRLVSGDTQINLKKLKGNQRTLFMQLFFKTQDEVTSTLPEQKKAVSASNANTVFNAWLTKITSILTKSKFQAETALTAEDMEKNSNLSSRLSELKKCLYMDESGRTNLIKSVKYTGSLPATGGDVVSTYDAALTKVENAGSDAVITGAVHTQYENALKESLKSSDKQEIVTLNVKLPETSGEKTVKEFDEEFQALVSEIKTNLGTGMKISDLFYGKDVQAELSALCSIEQKELEKVENLGDKILKTDISQTKDTIVTSWKTQLEKFMIPELQKFSESLFGEGALGSLSLTASNKNKDVIDALTGMKEEAAVLTFCADVVASFTDSDGLLAWLKGLLGDKYTVVETSDYTRLSDTSSALEARVKELEAEKESLEKSVDTLTKGYETLKEALKSAATKTPDGTSPLLITEDGVPEPKFGASAPKTGKTLQISSEDLANVKKLQTGGGADDMFSVYTALSPETKEQLKKTIDAKTVTKRSMVSLTNVLKQLVIEEEVKS